MQTVTLGKDNLPFGEDDLFDYLSQYGHVRHAHNAFHLYPNALSGNRVTLCVTRCLNTFWYACLFVNNRMDGDGSKDVQLMVNRYLEALHADHPDGKR